MRQPEPAAGLEVVAGGLAGRDDRVERVGIPVDPVEHGVEGDEGTHALGRGHRRVDDDAPAHRQPDQDGRVDAEVVDHRPQIVGMAERDVGIGIRRLAMPPAVVADDGGDSRSAGTWSSHIRVSSDSPWASTTAGPVPSTS